MDAAELERHARRAFARWNAGDFSLDPDWVDPDVEIVSAATPLNEGGAYRGHEGFLRWVADISESFDEWRLELAEFEPFAPGRVLGVGAVHFRGRGSGVIVDLPCAWLFDHRDGVLVRLEAFPNRVEEARALARS
jgi:ketosteroid isomerase-like protein